MYTAKNPVPKLETLPEEQLAPLEGYPPEEDTAEEADEQHALRAKKRKTAAATASAGSSLPALPVAKRAKQLKKKGETKSGKTLVQQKLTKTSPATAPPTPSATTSAAPEAQTSPATKDLEEQTAPEAETMSGQLMTDTQDVTSMGEATADDPINNPPSKDIASAAGPSNPSSSHSGLSKKTPKFLDDFAQKTLDRPAEEDPEQETEDVKLDMLLEAVRKRDAALAAAGGIPSAGIQPLTLPEQVYITIREGFIKLHAEHIDLLKNISNKRREIKTVNAENAKLQQELKEAQELLARSHKVVERAQDFEVLERENAGLRTELENLKKNYEKGIQDVLESSSHETERLGKDMALRDKEIRDLKDEMDRQSESVSEIRDKLESRIEEQNALDRYVLEPSSWRCCTFRLSSKSDQDSRRRDSGSFSADQRDCRHGRHYCHRANLPRRAER